MNSLSTRKVAFFLSLFLWVLLLAACYLSGAAQNYSTLVLFLSSLASFLVLFGSCYFTIDYFIYNKIRVIYKTIHQLKVGASEDETPGRKLTRDLLEMVNRNVQDWAEGNREEIEQLRSLEKYRKEFIGNVSHELKTPIFNIQGYILTLLEGGLEDETINREYLQRAEKSVERMITIVEELETITQLESGQMQIEKESFDLLKLVREVFNSEEMKASGRGISLGFQKQYDKPIRVIADRDRIRQVLTNLVVNSIKYGKENGHTEVRFFDLDENVLVEVADDGYGIDQHHLPRLFERFYRVDKSRSREQGGSGLGLAIVKHIVEAHQQTINVRSKKGEGSAFSFTLKKA